MEIQNIVHRDIKPDNLIVRKQKGVESWQSLDTKRECDICVIDFGFSTDLTQKKPHRNGCGTLGYMAPETILKKESTNKLFKVSSKADVYSAGIIFYEMYVLLIVAPLAATLSKETPPMIAR